MLDVTWRNTTIVTPSNDVIIVPNAVLGRRDITNFSTLTVRARAHRAGTVAPRPTPPESSIASVRSPNRWRPRSRVWCTTLRPGRALRDAAAAPGFRSTSASG